MPLEVLLNTGTGGGTYISLHLYKNLGAWGSKSLPLRRYGGGQLKAANPSYTHVLPMNVVGLMILPLVFHPEDRILDVSLHIV